MKAVRIGLCVLLAFSVFAHGVVEVWSLSALEIGTALLLLYWGLVIYRDPRVAIQWSPTNRPLLGFMAIGLLQLAIHSTANPFRTRMELLRLAAYFILFFLSAQAFRERSHFVGLAWFLMLLGFSVSLLGVIQHFTSEGTIYWVRHLTQGGDVFGPYVNRNHFAGFVELVVPVGMALLIFRGLRRDLFPLTGLLTILPVGALVLAGSRGGIVCFAFEVGVLLLLAREREVPGRTATIAIAFVALCVLAFIAWLGAGKAIERFSNTSLGDVSLSRRASMFRAAISIFRDHPIQGTGLGTMISVFPRYDTAYDGLIVDHVHNDYLELLAETGLLGGLCGISFLWLVFRGALRTFAADQGYFSRALHAGAIAAVCGILLHSFVDFNLHIPSNAILFLLQCCVATSPPLPSESATARRLSRRHEPDLAVRESY